MYVRRAFTALLATLLLLATASPAFALAPQTLPGAVIPAEGFESALPSYLTVSPYQTYGSSTGWWGRISFVKHGGASSLWCAGSTAPSSWPAEYPLTSGGRATFDLTRTVDYYSSNLGFYYLMPSLGDDDARESMNVGWYDSTREPGNGTYHYGASYFPLTATWAFKSASLSSPSDLNLSRRPMKIVFQWWDGPEDANQTHLSGQGPSIDDVSVTGYMYGPIRSLSATRSGGSVQLDWAAPYTAVGSSLADTRTISYHVFRSADAAPGVWTDLTTTTSRSYSDPSPLNEASHYFVQAFNAAGTAWGDPSGSSAGLPAPPDATAPTTSISSFSSAWRNSNLQFTLNASDPEAWNTLTTYYRYSGGGWLTYPGSAVTLSTEGETLIEYYSKDQANNEETPKSATARIDKSAPVTNSNVAIDASGTAIVSLYPFDMYSGVAGTAWSVAGGASGTGTTIALSTPGTYTISYSSTDLVGNVETPAKNRQVVVPAPGEAAVDDVEGANRYETGVAAVQRSFPATASTVVIAYGQNFPDALGGSALCGAYDAPLLLTQKDYIPTAVRDKIKTLKPTKAIILGSTSSVSSAVEQDLRNNLISGTSPTKIVRIGGLNRYDTAAQVATATMSRLATSTVADVFLAVGDNFPDALAASPAAFAKRWPILLTPRTGLSANAKTALSAMKTKRIHILGSNGAVPDAIRTELEGLGYTVDRWAGANRYATAVDIASRSGLSYAGVAIATGDNFPDALAGGVMQGKLGGPVLLTKSAYLVTETHDALVAHKAAVKTVRYLGSDAAVSQAVRDSVGTALQP